MSKSELFSMIVRVVFICVLSYWAGFMKGKAEKKLVIKDPIVIYDNLKTEVMDNRGVFGVMSKEDFKKFLGYKNTFELMREGGK